MLSFKEDMEKIQITKKTVQSYDISNNGEWGTVVIELGESSAKVFAHTSFGEYGYTWNATGSDPIEFLKTIGFDYAMTKFKGLHEVFDQTSQLEYLKEKIGQVESLSCTDSENYMEEAESICEDANDSNTFMLLLSQTDLMEALFDGQYDGVEIKTKPNGQCVGFWNEIWTPLVKSL